MRRGRTAHDADDLVQEAWVRLAGYEDEHVVERPEAFLMQVALNLSIDTYRQRAGREEVMLEDVVLVDTAPGVEAVVLARERVARLSACLARLPELTREVFMDYRLGGFTYQQIAQQRRLSLSAVERQVSKATLLLTTWMEGW